MVSDDVARTMVERYGSDASPQRWLHVSSEDIGELAELKVSPTAGLNAQFAFVTLEGRTEAPALRLVRQFCMDLAQAGADQSGA